MIFQNSKAVFIQGEYHNRYVNFTEMGLCNRGERLGLTLNTTRKSGNLRPRNRLVGGISVDKQLLKGNIKGKKGSWLN